MKKRLLGRILNWPFIWATAPPLILLDIFIEIYHQVGFRLLGIKRVNRSKYIKFDRHKLGYLNIGEKVACTYCAYANGWFAYGSEIAARTEEFYCAIKHQELRGRYKPKHHKKFAPYGNKNAFRKKK